MPAASPIKYTVGDTVTITIEFTVGAPAPA